MDTRRPFYIVAVAMFVYLAMSYMRLQTANKATKMELYPLPQIEGLVRLPSRWNSLFQVRSIRSLPTATPS